MSTSSSSPYPSYRTTRTLSTSPHISKLTQSTSGAIKNHSGVKTWRVAETPRTTTPTGYEPKELATVSRIETYSGHLYQLYDVQEKLEKKITELVLPMNGRNLEKSGRLLCRILNYQRNIQSQMHFDDSVESIADSDLEDGELQKMLTSPLYVQKASEKSDALFSSEQGNLIRSSVFRHAKPSNLRGSLLEGNEDHWLNQARSDPAKQELHVESLNKCIGELQRQTEEQRLALQDAQYGFVESRREQVRLEELSVIKFTLLVDSDTTVHAVHTYTVVFSPILLTICSQSFTDIDAHSALAQEKDPRHIVTHSHNISSGSPRYSNSKHARNGKNSESSRTSSR